MNIDFARAMSRATASVRAQDLAAATAIIQAALAGEPFEAPSAPQRPRFRVVPDAEDAELAEPGSTADAPAPMAGRSLRDVVGLLRSGRAAFEGLDLRLPGGASRPAAPAIPDGASFIWQTHACEAGSRRYRLFVPSCPREELQGLVVMLHGCKQDPDDFAAGTGMNALAEEQRFVVAWPAQPGPANISGCWNWFEPGHQKRNSGEPAILASLARALVAEFGLPEDRVYAAGLSAGGAMAAILAETHPEVFAAVGIHSGLPCGAAQDVVSAFAAMRAPASPAGSRRSSGRTPRVIVFHGTADRTVHPGNGTAILAGARAAGSGVVTEAVEAGTAGHHGWRRTRIEGKDGVPQAELWLIDGAGHAWAGGNLAGSFTDPSGPAASAEMLRFFAGRS